MSDLTLRPPRSVRIQLGGFVILPRMLDKCRAEIAGKSGEYHYNCPLDQRFLSFAGIDPAALRKEVETGKGDGEILAWITANSTRKLAAYEIAAWSQSELQRVPDNVSSREFFNSFHKEVGPERTDISTWAEMLDLDDYVSYGGKA